MLQTQFYVKPKILRSDNEGEYINSAIKQFLSDHGMLHQTSCADTPQQNGIAERKKRTSLEITQAILIESHAPTSFWPKQLLQLLSHQPSPLQTLTIQNSP